MKNKEIKIEQNMLALFQEMAVTMEEHFNSAFLEKGVDESLQALLNVFPVEINIHLTGSGCTVSSSLSG